MDEFQLNNIKRRKAELEGQIDVLDAQYRLRLIYFSELQEIDAFLSAVEAAQQEVEAHGEGDHA